MARGYGGGRREDGYEPLLAAGVSLMAVTAPPIPPRRRFQARDSPAEHGRWREAGKLAQTKAANPAIGRWMKGLWLAVDDMDETCVDIGRTGLLF